MTKNVVTTNGFRKKSQENEALLVRKLMGTRAMDMHENIFQTWCKIQGHFCALMIDNGSGPNLVSSRVVSKLNLKRTPLPFPYKSQWIEKGEYFVVKEQVTFEFSIGSYHDKILCEVVPMEIHLLLGRSWQYDKRATFYGDKNKYKFVHDKKGFYVKSLSSREIFEFQCKIRKQIEQESKSETLVSENERQRESEENTLSANTLSEELKGELCLNSHFFNHTLVYNSVCLDFQVAQEEVPKGTLTIAPSLEEDKTMKTNQWVELCSRPITHCIIGSNYLNMCLNDRLGAALSLQHELIHKQHPRALENNVHISLLQPYRSFYFVLVSLTPFIESSPDPCHQFVFDHAYFHYRTRVSSVLFNSCVKNAHGSKLYLLLEFPLVPNNNEVLKGGFVWVVFDPGGKD